MIRLKPLKEMLELSNKAFADKYEIPLRTLEDWQKDRRKAPIYLINLLEYKVINDTIRQYPTSFQDKIRTYYNSLPQEHQERLKIVIAEIKININKEDF